MVAAAPAWLVFGRKTYTNLNNWINENWGGEGFIVILSWWYFHLVLKTETGAGFGKPNTAD